MIYQAKYDDLIDLLCSDLLGEGISRKVFLCSLNPDWVVKIETDDNTFQNLVEWKVWLNSQGSKSLSKWLSPYHYFNNSGKILIQSKTIPIRKSDIPDRVPHFFNDEKFENYGILNGQFVCHDYGTLGFVEGMSKRLVKQKFY